MNLDTRPATAHTPPNWKRFLIPDNNARVWFLVALLALSYAISGAYTSLYGDRIVLLGRADLWGQFAPTAYYLDYALNSGEFPEWNPLVFCGVPFAANPQSAAFYPPNLLRACFNSPPTPLGTFQSLAVMQALHLLVLGIGVYLLCLRFGISKLAATTVAVAVVLSAPVAYRTVQHWTFIAVAAHFPWQLLVLQTLLSAKAVLIRIRWAIVLGVVTASSILAGAPHLLVYSVFLLGVFALCHRGHNLFRQESRAIWRKTLATDALCAGIAVMVALGVSAVATLPAAEFAQHCARAKADGADTGIAAAAHVRQLHTPGSVLHAMLVYPGEKSLRFMGALGGLLALCAMFRRCNWIFTTSIVMFLCALDLSLGPPMPLATLAEFVSPFYLSEPERAMLFGIFAMAMLTALGLDGVQGSPTIRFSAGARAFIITVAGSAATLWLYKLLPDTPHAAWWMWVLPALGVLFLASTQVPSLGRVMGYCVAIVVLLHLGLSAQHYTSALAHSNPYPGNTAELGEAASWPEAWNRGLSPKWLENTGIFRLQPVINGYDPLIPRELDTLLRGENASSTYDKRVSPEDVTTNNTLGMTLLNRRFHLAYTHSFEPMPRRDSVNFLPSHVVFLSDKPTLDVSIPVAQSGNWVLPLEVIQDSVSISEHNKQSFVTEQLPNDPRLRLLEVEIRNNNPFDVQVSSTLITSESEQPSLIWQIAGESTHTQLVPLSNGKDLRLLLGVYPEDAAGSIAFESIRALADPLDTPNTYEQVRSSPNSAEIRLTGVEHDAWLLFTDYYYPGWKAYINGNEAFIHKANAAFQAVQIPPGDHSVRFEFRSSTVRLGFWVTLLSLLLSFAVFCLMLVLERTQKVPAHQRM